MVHSSGHKLLHWLKRSPDSGSQWLEQVLAEPQVAKVKHNTTLFSYLIRSFNALLEGPSPPPELLGSDTDDGVSDVGSEDGDTASTFFSSMPGYIMEKYISPHIQDFVAHEVDTHIAPVLRTTCIQVTLGCIGMEVGKQVLRKTVGKLPVLGKGLCWLTRVAMPTPVYGTAIGLYVAFRKLSKARVKEAARQMTGSGAKTPKGKNAPKNVPKNAALGKPAVKPGAYASKAPTGRAAPAPSKTPPPTPKPGSAAAAAAAATAAAPPSRWGGSSPGRTKSGPLVTSPGSPKQAAPPSPSQKNGTPSGRSASPFTPPASMPSLSTILSTAYNSLPPLPYHTTLPAHPKSKLPNRGTTPPPTASTAAGPPAELADYRPASSIKASSSLPPVHPVLPPLNTGQLHHTHHHAAAHKGGAGTHAGGALGAEPSRLSRLSRPSSPTVSRSTSPHSASHAHTVSGRGSPFSPGRTLSHTQSIGRSSFEARAAVYETQHDRPPSPDPCGHSVTSCNMVGCTTHPHPCSYHPDPGRAVNPLRQRSRCGSPAHGAGPAAVPLINPDTPTTPGSSKLAAWKLGDEGYLWGGSSGAAAAAAGASSGAASPKSPGSRLHGWGLFNLDAGDGGDGGGAAATAAALSGRPSTSRHTRTRSLEAAAVAANLMAGRPCCPAPTSTPAMSESGHNNVGAAVQCTLARAAALPGSDPPCALPSPFMAAAGGAGGPAAAANTSVRTIFKWSTDDQGHLHVSINLRPSPPPSPKPSTTQIPSPSFSPRTSPPRTSQPPASLPPAFPPRASQPVPPLPSPSHTPRTPSPDPRPTSRPANASNNAPHPTKAAPTGDAAPSAASPAPTSSSPPPTGPHPPHHPQPPLDLQQLPQLSSSIPIPFSAAAKQASRSRSPSPSPGPRSLLGSPQAHVTMSPLLHHGMISLLGAALDEDQTELEGRQVTTLDATALHAATTANAAGPTSFAPASLEEMLARRVGPSAGMGVGVGTGASLPWFSASQLQPHLPSPPSFSGGVEVARQGSLFDSWLIKPSDA